MTYYELQSTDHPGLSSVVRMNGLSGRWCSIRPSGQAVSLRGMRG